MEMAEHRALMCLCASFAGGNVGETESVVRCSLGRCESQ
jgi:hypothetical protein